MMINFDYLGHIARYNRSFADVAEFAKRLENFTIAHNWINEHNASGASWVAGHNQFSDWSHAEYKAILGYAGRSETEVRAAPKVFDTSANADTVNWVTAGAVTPVKDQGQCGSCWAFSSTGGLEGAHFVATGTLLSFSEQQLVDCAYIKYGNYGCNGGLQENAYKYYEAGYKAELESVYPYTSGTGTKGSCQYSASSATAVDVSNYTNVTPDNVDQMKAALNQQPLAVSIEADKFCFQTYKSGVLNNPNCGTNLDHAVLAVGYGTDATAGDYWLVKNSWGTSWGESGYIRLAIVDGEGTCGVQMDPLFPTSN